VVTNLTGTASININGTVGATTPAAGAFTTLNTSGAVVFNEAGANVDFRVEGDTEPSLLFVDASADKVGIGTSSPLQALQVKGKAILGLTGQDAPAASVLHVFQGNGSNGISWGDSSFTTAAYIGTSGGALNFSARVNPSTAANPASPQLTLVDGRLGIGTTSPAARLHIQGSSTSGAATNISSFNGLRIDGNLAGSGVTGITYQDGGGGGAGIGLARGGAFETQILFYTNPASTTTAGAMTERMRIDSQAT
jgi:hypothetical protein